MVYPRVSWNGKRIEEASRQSGGWLSSGTHEASSNLFLQA